MKPQPNRNSVAAQTSSHKLYRVVSVRYSEYAPTGHNHQAAFQAEFDLPCSNSFLIFLGSALTSRRESSASRLSIIQRVTIAAAHASTHASISTRMALAKLLERFSSASSASSSERFEASNRNSSEGIGMMLPWASPRGERGAEYSAEGTI
jgi:hypothetical protein